MDNIESFQIVMARKPLQGTVADNVTTWGVGGLNIDGCRVGDYGARNNGNSRGTVGSNSIGTYGKAIKQDYNMGRWPANVILDSIAGAALDAQSGVSVSKRSQRGQVEIFKKENSWIGESTERGHSDSGGASRFFYNSDTVDPIIERTNMDFQLLHGDNREQLKHLADNSIDSIVCDPPYELGFMGKRWDSTGIAYDGTVWAECLRVLKPGGHLIAFGGTRTYHRMTVAIEDAGFEIRDCIMWLYGSGFPKSLDISKALDKQAGAEREVVGNNPYNTRRPNPPESERYAQAGWASQITAPATDLAKQWHGWGTALKPAVEPAVLARKPLIGTVADNVTTWGVGGINVDGCRVESADGTTTARKPAIVRDTSAPFGRGAEMGGNGSPLGRWPANVILDESAGEALDEQSGWSRSSSAIRHSTGTDSVARGKFKYTETAGHSDSGGASRFFYTAKASKAEREAGLEGMEVRKVEITRMNNESMEYRIENGVPTNPKAPPPNRANHHPTVKPIALMRYLVRLVTPKGGTVLDPFMGSGSTGCAAMCEGMNFVGIELSEEYLEIARRRIEYWQSRNPMGL